MNSYKKEIGLTSRQISKDIEIFKEEKKVAREKNESGKMEHAGPEKYKEHNSAAPRKGPFSHEGRSLFGGKQLKFDVKKLILMI